MIASGEHGPGGLDTAAEAGEDPGDGGVVDALRNALGSLLTAASQWLVLAELEARDAALRVIVAMAMAVAAVIFVAAAWFFTAAAGVAALVAGGASPAAALTIVALLNLLFGGVAIGVLWWNLREPWFLATRRQLGLSVATPAGLDDACITH